MEMELGDDKNFGGNQLYVDLGPYDYCPQDYLSERNAQLVLDRSEGQCEICCNLGQEIHCRWEATRSGWYMRRYMCVCRLCHAFQHAQPSNLFFTAIEHAKVITGRNCGELLISINNTRYERRQYMLRQRRIFHLYSYRQDTDQGCVLL